MVSDSLGCVRILFLRSGFLNRGLQSPLGATV